MRAFTAVLGREREDGAALWVDVGESRGPNETDYSSQVARRWRRLPTYLVALGVGLVVSYGDRFVVGGAVAPPLYSVDTVLGVATTLPFFAGFVYGGYWLRRSSLPVERYRRIGYWTGGSLVTFLGVNLAMIVVWWPGDVLSAVGWARFALAAGGAAGFLFGVIEARAIERERSAERSEVRAEMAEDQQQWFDYLNSLLRHEILNTVNVISGNTSLLLARGDLDDEAVARMETIRRNCRNMEHVIRDVRVLIDANNGDGHLHTVDLHEVIEEEVRALRDAGGSVTVELDVPESLSVVADELLARVVANLLNNAAKHNDDAEPTVWVTAEERDDTVVFHVEDDGPGVPERKRGILFERMNDGGTDHGLGLYLVRTLVDRYGGAVELTETGPNGSTFSVELPRAPSSDPRPQSANESTTTDCVRAQ